MVGIDRGHLIKRPEYDDRKRRKSKPVMGKMGRWAGKGGE
jgi:hypothetical protein